jgi:DNA-binding winged helix-turn-helix (wHTH) protein
MSGTRGDFRLGPILIEPDRLRLSLDGRAAIVQPRVMDVLVGLASASDTVISRRALEAQVWTDAHVGYHALARAVCEARKALEGISPGCNLLETIPRRGYRLKIAPIPVVLNSVRAPDRQPPLHAFGRRLLTAVVALLVLGLTMHAVRLHGSEIHLVSAAVILGWTLLWQSPRRVDQEGRGGG